MLERRGLLKIKSHHLTQPRETGLTPFLFFLSFVFRSGLKTVPGNAKVHYNYANLLKEEGKLKLAAYHYNQALR